MRTILTAGAAAMAMAGPTMAGPTLAEAPNDLPPNATPGHCYQRVTLPPVAETYQERAIDIPEHTATRTIPAVYGEVMRQVLVEPGRTEHYALPPTYRTITETEVVRPETVRTEVIPAEYERVSERVLVREAHTEWRRGYGPVSDPDMPRHASDHDIVCLIEIPAEYRWEAHRVLRAPEREIRTTIPAEVRTRTRQVIDEPGRDEVREIPPVYRAVKERVVVQSERVEAYTVPATYRLATRTRVTATGRTAWREYACRRVAHPPHHRAPENDGERGALDPAKVPAYVARPLALAEIGHTAPDRAGRWQ
jgi:hypothetical protein